MSLYGELLCAYANIISCGSSPAAIRYLFDSLADVLPVPHEYPSSMIRGNYDYRKEMWCVDWCCKQCRYPIVNVEPESDEWSSVDNYVCHSCGLEGGYYAASDIPTDRTMTWGEAYRLIKLGWILTRTDWEDGKQIAWDVDDIYGCYALPAVRCDMAHFDQDDLDTARWILAV